MIRFYILTFIYTWLPAQYSLRVAVATDRGRARTPASGIVCIPWNVFNGNRVKVGFNFTPFLC